jgi:hypothetical protein
MNARIASVALLIASGCAHIPAEDVAINDSDSLCNAYAISPNERIKLELDRRGGISEREWQSIQNQKVFVGMNETAVRCSWGTPQRINTTTTSSGPVSVWTWSMYLGDTPAFSKAYIKHGRLVAASGALTENWYAVNRSAQ